MRPHAAPCAALLTALLSLSAARSAHAVGVRQVEVAGPRMSAGDLVPGLAADAARVDLGPSPPAAGSRLVGRDELTRAFTDASVTVPARLPEAVRVVRRMVALSGDTLASLVRDGLDGHMPRGATLGAVRSPRTIAVPDGWTAVHAELPRPPRRTGALHTAALLTFQHGAEVLTQVSVPVEVDLGPLAAIPDAARGSSVRVSVQRGLVEVTVNAEASADADVGDVVPFILHPSGRVLRARLVQPDHAIVVEGP